MIATEASKQGKCPRCKRDILPGHMITKVQGTWVCADCGQELEANPEVGELEGGVLFDLDMLPPEASKSAIAKASLRAARMIDSGIVSPRDMGGLMKELRQNRAAMMELWPAEEEDDPTEKSRKARENMLGEDWEEPYSG